MKQIDWKIHLDRAAKALSDTITSLTDDELVALSQASSLVTESDCWFVSYAVAPIVSDIAANELQLRQEKAA